MRACSDDPTMASKLLAQMGLDASISHILSARNVLTAKDALCRTELELMELLDVPMATVCTLVVNISKSVCPPCHTVLAIMREHSKESASGHLPTKLRTLDNALCGGIPFGVVTEIVGPAGIGKSQFCLMLSVMAALPKICGGLGGSVLYFDTENKFRSGRLVEIAQSIFPDLYNKEEMIFELASCVLVFHPQSLLSFTESLQRLEDVVRERQVKLIIVDSVAALMESSEYSLDDFSRKRDILGSQASILKCIANSFRIPIVVTNHIRARIGHEMSEAVFSFEDASRSKGSGTVAGEEDVEIQLTAALGISWAHSVNIRLILESLSGQRFIKIAKSPVSEVVSFPYSVTSAGLVLIGSEFIESAGDDIMAIQNAGYEILLNNSGDMIC